MIRAYAILLYTESKLAHPLVFMLLASTSIAHCRAAADAPLHLLQQQPKPALPPRGLPPRGLDKAVVPQGLRHSVLMNGAAMGPLVLRGARAAVVDPGSSADGPLLACDKGRTWIFLALA